MARIEAFKGYGGEARVAKPDIPPAANVVTARDGTPVRYPGCEGIGVRVVHPSNPRAPAQAMGLVMFYLPPHVKMEPRGHLPEECYVILRGRGVMTLNGEQREVSAGTFVHLPPWCEHGIENTGDETLEVLICTSPPNR